MKKPVGIEFRDACEEVDYAHLCSEQPQAANGMHAGASGDGALCAASDMVWCRGRKIICRVKPRGCVCE